MNHLDSSRVLEPDDPVPLSEAVRLFFPAGGMTVAGLKTEARKGRLVVERIAGKYFVTRTAVEKMRELCRIEAKGSARIYRAAGDSAHKLMRPSKDDSAYEKAMARLLAADKARKTGRRG